VNVGGFLDGNYLVSGGVERLVLSARKVILWKWADKCDGLYDESQENLPCRFRLSATPSRIRCLSGSKIPNGMDQFEYYNLIPTLAPNESEGPHDKSEWNLFNEYPDSTAQALDNPNMA
jgi:hypothetical protein